MSFADGKLGDYAGDRALVYRLTQRIAEELQRLHPDVIVTWGGVPERVFYIYMYMLVKRCAR